MQRTTSIQRGRRAVKAGFSRRVRLGLGALLVLMTCSVLRLGAAPAGTVHYPDQQSVIPLDQFSIVQTSPTTREFRYTHISRTGMVHSTPTEYDPATDTARGFQRLYTHDANGTWSIVEEIPIVGVFQYHPEHGHYHFPLAQFGLFQVAPDGSVGAPVALSPKIGFCIGDSLVVHGSRPHVGVLGYFDSRAPPPMKRISVGCGDLYDRTTPAKSTRLAPTGWSIGPLDRRSLQLLLEKGPDEQPTDVKVPDLREYVTADRGRAPELAASRNHPHCASDGAVSRLGGTMSATRVINRYHAVPVPAGTAPRSPGWR